jgi:tetratricopeptide (TPR) repeat protein
LAHVLGESRRLEDGIGAAPLVQPMLAQLTLVEGLIIATSGSLRQEVVSIGSQYAQFAAWLHASTGNATVARQYYDRATEWALEADDANMVSTALSMKGHLAYRLGQLGPMLSLSQAAQRDTRLAPGIRALAAQQEARALALNGELDPCERKLDEAMELAVRANEHPDDEPPWVYFYSPEYFTMQRGRAYLYLGLYDKAVELLDAGLAGMPQELRDAEWAQPYQANLDAARKQLS